MGPGGDGRGVIGGKAATPVTAVLLHFNICESGCDWRDLRTSQALFVATKTGILSQNTKCVLCLNLSRP